MRKYDSLRTRLVPVFDALMDLDPTGNSWLLRSRCTLLLCHFFLLSRGVVSRAQTSPIEALIAEESQGNKVFLERLKQSPASLTSNRSRRVALFQCGGTLDHQEVSADDPSRQPDSGCRDTRPAAFNCRADQPKDRQD